MTQQDHNDMRETLFYTSPFYESPKTEVSRVLGVTLEMLRQEQETEDDRN